MRNSLPFALTAVALWTGPVLGQQPIIRAKVEVVNVLCTVRDQEGKGKYVEGLQKEDFEVFEDGVRQTLQFFYHSQGAEAEPLSIALLVDTSASVKNKLAVEQRAAVEFLANTLKKDRDMASVLRFDNDVTLVQDFTYDLGLLKDAIFKTTAGGGTKLFDAIWLASHDLLSREVGRRVAVVVSDGDDTLSEVSKKDSIRAAQDEDVVIYGIGVRDPRADSDFGVLKSFAQDTGGAFFNSEIGLERLRAAFDRINREIKNQYSIGYVSTNRKLDGAFRKLQVRVSRPGLQVKHRKRYYAGQADS
jgi:Ca-activated chloride channel family protein